MKHNTNISFDTDQAEYPANNKMILISSHNRSKRDFKSGLITNYPVRVSSNMRENTSSPSSGLELFHLCYSNISFWASSMNRLLNTVVDQQKQSMELIETSKSSSNISPIDQIVEITNDQPKSKLGIVSPTAEPFCSDDYYTQASFDFLDDVSDIKFGSYEYIPPKSYSNRKTLSSVIAPGTRAKLRKMEAIYPSSWFSPIMREANLIVDKISKD